jgi:hypothetical protein
MIQNSKYIYKCYRERQLSSNYFSKTAGYRREYYIQHREKLLNHQKKYYQDHKKRIQYVKSLWFQKNKERLRIKNGYERRNKTKPIKNEFLTDIKHEKIILSFD